MSKKMYKILIGLILLFALYIVAVLEIVLVGMSLPLLMLFLGILAGVTYVLTIVFKVPRNN
jgi:hypothetical protein